MYIATVTQKGQVTIPLALRTKYNVRLRGTVTLEEGNDFIKLTPAEDLLDVAGTFTTKKKGTAMKAREAFEKQYQRF